MLLELVMNESGRFGDEKGAGPIKMDCYNKLLSSGLSIAAAPEPWQNNPATERLSCSFFDRSSRLRLPLTPPGLLGIFAGFLGAAQQAFGTDVAVEFRPMHGGMADFVVSALIRT